MKKAVLFTGAGGQGVNAIALLLAGCAAQAGHATCLPEHGPEQRGGYARCTVVVSDTEICSPMPKKYDYVVAMDELSAMKYAAQLNPGGKMVLNADLVPQSPGEHKLFIPADSIAAELGNPRSANIVLLGALVGVSGLLPEALVKDAIAAKFKGQVNLDAFQKGLDITQNKS